MFLVGRQPSFTPLASQCLPFYGFPGYTACALYTNFIYSSLLPEGQVVASVRSDLANKNTGCLLKFEFQMRTYTFF